MISWLVAGLGRARTAAASTAVMVVSVNFIFAVIELAEGGDW